MRVYACTHAGVYMIYRNYNIRTHQYLWNAAKVVCRCKCIAQSACLRKKGGSFKINNLKRHR